MTVTMTFTSAELAALLGCDRGTVWAAWRDEGGIRVGDTLIVPIRVGRALRWPSAPVFQALGVDQAVNGHRCARCGAEIPEDSDGDDWFYVPEAGTPDVEGENYDPTDPRGELICAACNS